MDIKLRKSARKTSAVWNKIFAKPLRITAIVLACLFAGLSVTSYKFAEGIGINDFESDYLKSDAYGKYKMDMYEQLCVLSACYLNNVDDDWNFVGEKNLLSDFLYYMDYNGYKYRKTDKGILPVSTMFDYYVSFNDEEYGVRYITNMSDPGRLGDMDEDGRIEYLKEHYTNYILRRNDVITSDIASSGDIRYYRYVSASTGFYGAIYDEYYYDEYPHDDINEETYPNEFVPIGSWYYDNYGRYFYCFGNDKPIQFFDYPKNTEKGQIARNGIVSIVRDTDSWDELSNQWDGKGYYSQFEGTVTLDVTDEYLEDTERYEATPGDDASITVFISPKSEVVESAAASYKSIVNTYRKTKMLFAAGTVLTVICMLYLLASCGFDSVTEDGIKWRKPAFFGKRTVMLYFAVGGLYSLLAGSMLYYNFEEISSYVNSLLRTEYTGYVFYGLLIGVSALPLIFIAVQLAEKLKTRTFKEDLLTVRIFRKLRKAYLNSEMYANYQKRTMGDKLKRRSLKVIALCIVVAISFVGSLVFDYYIGFGFFILVSIFSFAAVLYLEIRNILSYRDLSKISRQIKLIGTDEPFEEKISEKSAVYNDSLTLTQISEKVKNSVEEQIKSERMKIELVANVSHDLKTPLTSIISYIDLLKKLELDEEASSYVQILDKKSQKLKSIVADVFSLAKATSGIDVNLVKLDFVMLFNQVLADADDKIKASGKTVKSCIYEKTAMVMADGDKLYRVFQNLVDNALNYSLEGSRIFFDIRRSEDRIIFESKNISSYPIEFTADEIVERFVRGDKSRTDGGSGLGLSIAKSFTEACGGEFVIELDGDMFKTIVSMPIMEEEETEKTEESAEDNKDIKEK